MLLRTAEARRICAALTLVLLRYGEDHPVFELQLKALEESVRIAWPQGAPTLGTTLVDLIDSVAQLPAVPWQEDSPDGLLTASLPPSPTGEPLVVPRPGTALASATTADRLGVHVRRALWAIDNLPPETTISEVALVSTAERAAILAAGTAPAPLDPPTTIHDAISRQAAARPDSEAVSDGSIRMTFRELDGTGDRMAAALQGLGIAPGCQVGVCLPRNTESVAVLLAVLKAGAAYVPLDPGYPTERLAYAATDAGLALMICTDETAAWLPGVRSVTPGQLIALVAEGSVPVQLAGPDDPAYTIYTSGSTGVPKGVVVPHRNVAALVSATRKEFELDETDVWSLFHSVTFDFSIWEMWVCLITGGRLVVIPYFASRSAEDFHTILVRERVTVLSQTPSAFWALQSVDAERDDPLAVRLLVFGGETLDPDALTRWFGSGSAAACRVVNMYGITETTVHVTHRTVTPSNAGSPSVGAPLRGWSVSVRDPQCRVLPFGAVGEIHVSGAGLATGYLNQSELTAERFIYDEVTGQRSYRSGDLGRLHVDGTVDHLGRIDDQVKLRGFRIELGEVRAALLDAPGVRAAAVVKEMPDAGDPASARLTGYIVVDAGTTGTDVRRRAAQRLPDHMVPAAIIVVPDLPLTPNGKLDRAALAGLATDTAGDSTNEPAAETLAARVLAAWRTVSPGARAHDDWFESGGNSLEAVKLLKALRAVPDVVEITVRDLYRHPSPAKLAQLLEARIAGQAD